MIDIWKRSELDKLMRKHGLRCSKALGQNFLTDKNILEKIVRAADIQKGDHIIEIGAGLGALTVLLAQAQTGRVTAVEIDRRLIPALREAVSGLSNVEIVNEDFLKYDLPRDKEKPTGSCRQAADSCRQAADSCERAADSSRQHNEEISRSLKIVGNLPYNITTPVIIKLIEESASFSRAVLMMQKEVAERLVAPAGKKTYGAISVLVQYYTEAEILFTVSREVFSPKPGVDSAVISLVPKDLSARDPETAACMFRLVRAGFDMRRKTLRNSLASAGYPEETLLAALKSADVDPVRRAETLSPDDFYNIASQL